MKHYAIAIDGPSGAGKSTLARRLAERLGILYVDTGAIYRTIGCHMRRAGVEARDEAAVRAQLPEVRLELRFSADGLQHMLLSGEDVTEEIRLPELSLYASAVSAYPAVRAFLLEMQRRLAREHSVIMDGRDIGTVVLPQAELKVFLTADVEERARRRERELMARGTPEPYERVLEEMKQRDYNDSHRAAAPLRRAEDAVLLDTTHMSFAESEEALLALARERLGVEPCR
ncbi:MAG: (d)CMP kinase [Oscillospiraceae bacterium]